MRKILLVLVALALGVSNSFGQERQVRGKVTSAEDGAVLPGVTILLKGTAQGTATDANGDYVLSVPGSGGVLVFSFVGLVTKEVNIGTQSTINVTMSSDITQLGEVIVTGYGNVKKETFTGSVGLVDGARLEQVPMTSFEQSLQGSMPGVQVVGADGTPGGNVQIRVRGIGSITASSEPLYVIDGMIVESGNFGNINTNGGSSANVMTTLNPNDIESVTVLKDAASTSLYGSRGANGVIVITTKSGKKGTAKINFSALAGSNSIANSNFLEPLNADQYTQLYLEGYMNRGETLAQAQTRYNNTFTQLTDPSTGQPTDTDWLESITRNGTTQSYNINASGGSDNIKYFLSGSYFDQSSYIIGNDMDRFTSRINLDFKLNENISIINNLSIGNTRQNGMTDGSAWANPLYNSFLLSPLIPIRDDQGRFNAEHQNYYPMGGNNPVGSLSGDDSRTLDQLRITDIFAIRVKFLKDFSFTTNWNFDIIQVDEFFYRNRRYGDGRNIGGYAAVNSRKNTSWIGKQTVTYGKTFAQNHDVDAVLVYEAQYTERSNMFGEGQGFPNDKLRNLASASSSFTASNDFTEYSFNSILASVNYGYSGKYYASASIRRDGSSRFGRNNRYGVFWSVGGGWMINREDFMMGISAISNLKLRASYGTTGNAGIGNFPSIGLYGYGQDYDDRPGGGPTQIGNPDLGWEASKNFNVGIDFGLFGRVNGSVEYFDRQSTDLILDVPLSRTTGFTTITRNFGSVSNKGVEILLNADVIRKGDFSWSLGFNISFLTNRVTDLVEQYEDGTKLRKEGEDYQSFFLYDWAGVDPSNGDPLWYTDETRTATTNNINQATRFLIGKSATPDYFGGFNTTLSYKELTLDAQFTYSQGNYIYYSEERFLHGDGALTPRSTTVWAFENRWTPENPNAKLPMHRWGGNKASNTANSSRWLHDGSFVRLRNLTVGYNFPVTLATKLHVNTFRVFLRGTNLLTFTKEKDLFMDPEQSINGINGSLTPAIKSISLGIDIGL